MSSLRLFLAFAAAFAIILPATQSARAAGSASSSSTATLAIGTVP